jgi:hypothetical protein
LIFSLFFYILRVGRVAIISSPSLSGGGWGKVDVPTCSWLAYEIGGGVGGKRQQDEEICSDNQKRRRTNEGTKEEKPISSSAPW